MRLNQYIRKPYKVFVRWLFSYLIILLIPLLISMIVFNKTSTFIQTEISNANMQILNQMKLEFDNEIININSIMKEICLNKQINTLMYNQDVVTPKMSYLLIQTARDEIARFASRSSFIKNIYVYFNKGNFVLTSGAKYDIDVAFDALHGNSHINYNEWYELMHKQFQFDTIVLPSNIAESAQVLNICSLPFNSKTPLANITVSFNEKKFTGMFQGVEWINESNFYVLDANDSIVYSNFSDKDVASHISSLKFNDNLEYFKISGEKYVAMNTKSDTLSWRFVSIVPTSYFLKNATDVYKSNTMGLVGCIIIGIIAVTILLCSNYHPLKQLLHNIRAKDLCVDNDVKNEYQIINKSLLRVAEENDNISKKLENQNELIFNNFLLKLLKGSLDDNQIQEFLLSNQIFFDSNKYAVMLLDCNNKDNDNNNYLTVHQKEKFIRNEIASFYSNDISSCYVVEINSYIAIILNIINIDDTQNVVSKNIAKSIFDYFCLHSNYIVTASVSGIVENIENVSTAYHQAMHAMEQRMVNPDVRIIMYDSVPKLDTVVYKYSLEAEQQIIDYVKSGETEKAKNVISDVLENNMNQYNLSVYMFKYLAYDLIGTFIKAVGEICDDYNKHSFKELKLFESLLDFNTIKEFKQGLFAIVDIIDNYVKVKNTNQMKNIIKQCVDYIESNYEDENLNISSIANHFNMNPNYLSKIFREAMEFGILDFVNKIRIRNAKIFLLDEHCSINNIATKVGYYNSVALNRAFKKYEGCTPGQWKNMQVK